MSKVQVNSIENVAGTVTMTVQELRDLLDAPSDAVGVDQTWQDVELGRAKDTEYLNDTGKPIMVAITIKANANASGVFFNIGALQVARYFTATNSDRMQIQLIVPNNTTYQVVSSNGVTEIEQWKELR